MSIPTPPALLIRRRPTGLPAQAFETPRWRAADTASSPRRPSLIAILEPRTNFCGRSERRATNGKPTFVYNFLSVERPTIVAQSSLPAGKTTLVVDFAYDGGGRGKGGTITMTANGTKVAEGRLTRTIPASFSLNEGLDIGCDTGSPIDFTYALPFAFTGKIEKVTVELKP